MELHSVCINYIPVLRISIVLDGEMAISSIRSLLSVSPNCNIGVLIPATLNFEAIRNSFLFQAPKHNYEFRVANTIFSNWNATQVSPFFIYP